jgi:hypothetical protein
MTGKYRTLSWVFMISSVLLNIGPLMFYTIQALCQSNLTYEKVSLCLTVFIVLILSAVCLINKVALKSRLWIILIGLYICLDTIMVPIIVIACCQVVDELIISPLAKHYKSKLLISKEIDKRMA